VGDFSEYVLLSLGRIRQDSRNAKRELAPIARRCFLLLRCVHQRCNLSFRTARGLHELALTLT
jgi:hypothetical protein